MGGQSASRLAGGRLRDLWLLRRRGQPKPARARRRAAGLLGDGDGADRLKSSHVRHDVPELAADAAAGGLRLRRVCGEGLCVGGGPGLGGAAEAAGCGIGAGWKSKAIVSVR